MRKDSWQQVFCLDDFLQRLCIAFSCYQSTVAAWKECHSCNKCFFADHCCSSQFFFLFPSPCHQLLNIIYEVCDKSSQQIWLGVPWQIVQLSCNIWYWYCMVLRGRPSPSEKANKTSETLNLEDIKISKVRPGNYILTVSSKVVRERSK